jgi:hypothetical protein
VIHRNRRIKREPDENIYYEELMSFSIEKFSRRKTNNK